MREQDEQHTHSKKEDTGRRGRHPPRPSRTLTGSERAVQAMTSALSLSLRVREQDKQHRERPCDHMDSTIWSYGRVVQAMPPAPSLSWGGRDMGRSMTSERARPYDHMDSTIWSYGRAVRAMPPAPSLSGEGRDGGRSMINERGRTSRRRLQPHDTKSGMGRRWQKETPVGGLQQGEPKKGGRPPYFPRTGIV